MAEGLTKFKCVTPRTIATPESWATLQKFYYKGLGLIPTFLPYCRAYTIKKDVSTKLKKGTEECKIYASLDRNETLV